MEIQHSNDNVTSLEDLAGKCVANITSLENLAGMCLDYDTSLEDLAVKILANKCLLKAAEITAFACVLEFFKSGEVVSQIGEVAGYAATHAQVYIVEALRYIGIGFIEEGEQAHPNFVER